MSFSVRKIHLGAVLALLVMLLTAASAFHQPLTTSTPLPTQNHAPLAASRMTKVDLRTSLKDNDTADLDVIDDPTNHDTAKNPHATAMLIAASAVLLASDPAMAADTLSTATAVTTIPATATTTTTLAAAGPVGSAAFAWLHFLGIMGVAGGLVTERLVIKKNMSVDEENIINGADLIYGLSALSLLITGYFRVSQYAKGWDYYKNEPIFWIKMSSVAVLGALSFFPAIVFFRRDMARKEGANLPPLSDKLVDRCTTIINAELLAILTIPFMASLMARGVLYVNDLPWGVGAALYVVSLGGAGFKYITEALQMMEDEGALVPLDAATKDDD